MQYLLEQLAMHAFEQTPNPHVYLHMRNHHSICKRNDNRD